jgi:hypothetical protein
MKRPPPRLVARPKDRGTDWAEMGSRGDREGAEREVRNEGRERSFLTQSPAQCEELLGQCAEAKPECSKLSSNIAPGFVRSVETSVFFLARPPGLGLPLLRGLASSRSAESLPIPPFRSRRDRLSESSRRHCPDLGAGWPRAFSCSPWDRVRVAMGIARASGSSMDPAGLTRMPGELG